MLGGHWNPFAGFGEIESAVNDMNQIFGRLDDSGGMVTSRSFSSLGGDGGFSSRQRSSGGWTCAVDIADSGDAYKLTADLPGVKKDDVTLSVNGSEVCLSAVRAQRDAGGQWMMAERRGGSFERCWQLPSRIHESNVAADLDNGVLSVQLQKMETTGTGGAPVRIDWGK